MKVPRSVRVLGQTYLIEVIDDGRPLGAGDPGAALGWSDHNLQLIRLNDLQSDDSLRDTLLHEALHCIAHLTATELDEGAVTRLSTALLETLRSNPKLVRALLK